MHYLRDQIVLSRRLSLPTNSTGHQSGIGVHVGNPTQQWYGPHRSAGPQAQTFSRLGGNHQGPGSKAPRCGGDAAIGAPTVVDQIGLRLVSGGAYGQQQRLAVADAADVIEGRLYGDAAVEDIDVPLILQPL